MEKSLKFGSLIATAVIVVTIIATLNFSTCPHSRRMRHRETRHLLLLVMLQAEIQPPNLLQCLKVLHLHHRQLVPATKIKDI